MAWTSPILDKKTSERVRSQLEGGSVDWSNKIFKWLVFGTLVFSMLILGVLLYQMFAGSLPIFSKDIGAFFANGYTTRVMDNPGVFQGMRGTFWVGVFVVCFSFPIGISAAVYLEEYAPDNWLTRLINVNIRNLAGVPSVVYGLLGLFIFVQLLKGVVGIPSETLGRTTTAGGLTLAILSLPVVIITSSEAIRAVPESLRQAAYGVGATKSQVIRSHVLPYAAPGILTGSLLSLARALGEAAPLLVVGAIRGSLGDKTGFLETEQLGESFTAMPMVITQMVKQPGDEWRPVTSAAIVVLLLIVLGFNAAAVLLRNRFEARRDG